MLSSATWTALFDPGATAFMREPPDEIEEAAIRDGAERRTVLDADLGRPLIAPALVTDGPARPDHRLERVLSR